MANNTETKENIATIPENAKYDDKVVKKLIASALVPVEGFLGTTNGVMGSIASMLQKNTSTEDEIIHGITASLKDGEVDVSIKAITEAGKNIPAIINQMTESVKRALMEVGGLETKSVNVEIVDTMTKAEYEEKYLKVNKDTK